MFTKQHFEALAKLIKTSEAKSKYEIAQDMAKLFSEDNDRFNVSKFYKACGILLETETTEQKQARAVYQKLGCAEA